MKTRNSAGLLDMVLIVLVAVLLVVSLGDNSVGDRTESVKTSTETQTATFINSKYAPIFVTVTRFVEPTLTLTPTVTVKPTETATPKPTATTPFLATPRAGYTFYGTQLKFLEENFGWSYEVSSCASGYWGVSNVKVGDFDSCAIRLYPLKKDRSGGVYLFRANQYKFAEGSSTATPYNYRLYLYAGKALDSDVNWGSLSGTVLWDELTNTGFYDTVRSESSACNVTLGPSIQRIYPLSWDEYEVIVENPHLFPLWVEYCKFQ